MFDNIKKTPANYIIAIIWIIIAGIIGILFIAGVILVLITYLAKI